MFDLSDHALTTISAWTEVAILLFMVFEAYRPHLDAGQMTNIKLPSQEGCAGFRACRARHNTPKERRPFPRGKTGLVDEFGFQWYSLNQSKGRRVSDDQKHILIREFSKAKSKIPRVLFTHFDDPQGEALQYMRGLMDAVLRSGIVASNSGNQTPTDQSQEGIILFAQRPSPISIKISKALTAARIDHKIEDFHEGQTEFKVFVGNCSAPFS